MKYFLLCSCESSDSETRREIRAEKRVTVEGGLPKEKNLAVTTRYYGRKALIYRGGDDSREDPPVPIPNTEVKLSYAESTVRSLGREDR